MRIKVIESDGSIRDLGTVTSPADLMKRICLSNTALHKHNDDVMVIIER